MIATTLGVVLVALGLGGIRYAPAIVGAQRREGMAPFGDAGSELDAGDRIRATKGTGVVFVVVGLALVAYDTGLV